MKLNIEQISEIDKYINTFQIKYYELKQEFLDHMICRVEAILDKKKISLKEAILEAKKDFEPIGFRGIMEERQKELRKKYRKQHWNSIKEFFKFPQISLTVFLLVLFYYLLNNFNNSFKTGFFVYILCFPIIIYEYIKIWKYRKKEGQTILRTDIFLADIISIGVLLPQSFLNFINGFKENLDFNSSILKIIISIVLVYGVLSIIVFRKMAIKEREEVQRLYFS